MRFKQPRIESKKLRDSAQGQDCTFQIAGVCCGDSATTVLCHIDSEDKGMGKKSHDFFAAFGCQACHAWLDQHQGSELDRLFYSLRAVKRTIVIWLQQGLITVAGYRS